MLIPDRYLLGEGIAPPLIRCSRDVLMSNWIESLKVLAAIPGARAHVQILHDQIRAFENERNRLNAQNIELKRQLEGKAKALAFEKFDGVLWKRRPDGEAEPSPYCPQCDRHPRMIPFPNFDPQLEWVCTVCRFSVGTGAVRPPR